MKPSNAWRDNLLGRLERAGVDIEEFTHNPDLALDRLVHEVREQIGPRRNNDSSKAFGERMPTGVLIIDDDAGFRIEGGVADLSGGGEYPVLMISLAPYGFDDTLHLVFEGQNAFRDFGHAITDAASIKMYAPSTAPNTTSVERFLQALRGVKPDE
jgi:hypothetical protein